MFDLGVLLVYPFFNPYITVADDVIYPAVLNILVDEKYAWHLNFFFKFLFRDEFGLSGRPNHYEAAIRAVGGIIQVGIGNQGCKVGAIILVGIGNQGCRWY